MISLEYVRTMSRYNTWMNACIFEICAAMPDAERRRDRGAFFKSIHGTLNHLLLADRLWLGRFLGEPFEIRGLDQELCADFDALRKERARTDADIETWVASLDDGALASELAYTSVVDPAERTVALWFAIAHFFNHQTHHRGQVTTLIKQAGFEPGITDLLWLPAVERTTGQGGLTTDSGGG